MEEIIEPIDRKMLKSELRPEFFMRNTNFAGNEIYTMRAKEAPNVMLEIGRLRELAFRGAGGGTGKSVDIDDQDMADDGYEQLIVWDPVEEQILGGYRYIVCKSSNPRNLSTEHYFRFSEKFRNKYLPYTIELGRSFVQPRYQKNSRDAKSLYSLDNLWDGLGGLIVSNPRSQYFFGKVTMYTNYDVEARNILIYFLQKHFPDPDRLMEPLFPVPLEIDYEAMKAIFTGADYKEDYRILVQELRKRGEIVPPLINSYMNLSPSMRVFSTVYNPDFGEVEETALLVTIADMYPTKVERHFKNLQHLIDRAANDLGRTVRRYTRKRS